LTSLNPQRTNHATVGATLCDRPAERRKQIAETDVYINVNFQLRSSINAGLTERSLYNRFCIERSPKTGLLGDFRRRG